MMFWLLLLSLALHVPTAVTEAVYCVLKQGCTIPLTAMKASWGGLREQGAGVEQAAVTTRCFQALDESFCSFVLDA